MLGSGKTLIAAMLLRHTVEVELEERARGHAQKTAFFLVNSVALVFQQYAVLECNLDYPIAKFCGDMVRSKYNDKEFWANTWEANMIIVCTADILLDCLRRAFIRMDQINLLIFDECHHAKKNHPYGRIIKDFYPYTQSDGHMPRIFGMTASPVDALANVQMAARELEGLLHSEIATVSDANSLQRTVCKPKDEKVVQYTIAVFPSQSDLVGEIRRLVGDHRLFEKHFAFTKYALEKLGPWCCDRFWQRVLALEHLPRHEAKAERDFVENKGYGARRDNYVSAVRQAALAVSRYSFKRPEVSLLSDKVRKLREMLFEQFVHSGRRPTRCIVFVERIYTARSLVDLFQQPEMSIPGLAVDALVSRHLVVIITP